MIAVAGLYVIEIIIMLSSHSHEGLVDIFRTFSVLPLGAISIILGMGFLRLQDGMGRIAKVAGRLELAFGISYLTLIFSFVGVILLAPLLVVEVVLLSKADNLAKQGQL